MARPPDQYDPLLELDTWLTEAAAASWAELEAAALQDSFVSSVLPPLIDLTVEAQAAAADIGAGFTARELVGEGISAPRVAPGAFAGTASDGRPLGSLLAQPLVDTYTSLAHGFTADEALAHGGDSLDAILTTQVHDAARAASQVAIVGSNEVTYWVRIVEPGACSRCILLSGRKYRWSQGFQRHPRCRCSMAPETVARTDLPSPAEIFESMGAAEQDRIFGRSGAQAIRDGSDLGQVVNARLGMTTTVGPLGRQLKATTIGGRGRRRRVRLMPEAIYELAGDDRAEAIRLLKLHGFITG